MTTHNSDTSRPHTGERRCSAVLLVDDQPFVGMAVGRLLAAERDIELHCCHTADAAIAHANQINPALVLQDLVMPDIDGLTLVGHFRANAVTATTPIIVLSGNDDPVTRSRALAAGAADYLVKLPPKDVLVGCIRRHLGDGAARPASGPAPVTAADGRIGETLDRAVIAALREGAPGNAADFITELIDQFMAETASLAARLTEAARSFDAPALTRAAHSLKGTSMTMGAQRLAALSARVEDQLNRYPDAGVEPALLTAIADEVRSVHDACAVERRFHVSGVPSL